MGIRTQMRSLQYGQYERWEEIATRTHTQATHEPIQWQMALTNTIKTNSVGVCRTLSLHMSKNVFTMFCVMFGDTVLSLLLRIHLEKSCVRYPLLLLLLLLYVCFGYFCLSVLVSRHFTYIFIRCSCSCSCSISMCRLVLAFFLIPHLQLGIFLCPYNDCVVHASLFLFMRVHISVILCDYIFHYIRAFFPFTCCICIFCS